MTKLLKRYVSINPKILGGTPVISGTRIPVERVFELIKQGHTINQLQNEYPWVEKRKIQKTIAYLMSAGLDAFEKAQKVQAASR